MKQKGSALISALFIMTLVAMVAIAMSSRLQLDIQRTRLIINADKLYLASQAISFWAMEELSQPKKHFRVSAGHGKVATFPLKLQRLYPQVKIQGALYDLQAKFNLNNLTAKNYQGFFLKILQQERLQLTPPQSKAINLALRNWLDPDEKNLENLAYYLKQQPSYLPGNQLLKQFSEFRLVQGVEASLYQNLKNYCTVLPGITPINLNTASKFILRSLGKGLSETQAEEILAARGKTGILRLQDLHSLLEKFNIPLNQVTIDSQYFLSIAFVEMADLKLQSYTVFKRAMDKNNLQNVSIIAQSLNAF